MLRGRILVGHSLHNDLKVRLPAPRLCPWGSVPVLGALRSSIGHTSCVLPVSPQPHRHFHQSSRSRVNPDLMPGPCPCSSTFHVDTARPLPLQPSPVAVNRAPARSGPLLLEAVRAATPSTSAAGPPHLLSLCGGHIAGGRRAGRVHSWCPRGCGLRPLLLEGLSR